MVTVPSFLLRRLYVRGSLRNTDQGFQFELVNRLGTGYAREMLPLAVDDHEVPLERCTFVVDGVRLSFNSVSDVAPFALDMNKTSTITIKGITLSDEPHRIAMAFKVAGLGYCNSILRNVPSGE